MQNSCLSRSKGKPRGHIQLYNTQTDAHSLTIKQESRNTWLIILGEEIFLCIIQHAEGISDKFLTGLYQNDVFYITRGDIKITVTQITRTYLQGSDFLKISITLKKWDSCWTSQLSQQHTLSSLKAQRDSLLFTQLVWLTCL